MAELHLTDAEKAAALWTDLDDAALGALLRKKLTVLQTAAAQMDKTTQMAAALLLRCDAANLGATEMGLELDSVTQDGKPFGDWRVKVSRRAATPTGRLPGEFLPGATVKHLKTQGEYRILLGPDHLKLESTGSPAYAYQSTTPGADTVWVRCAAEMEDGRFILVENACPSRTSVLRESDTPI